MDNLYYYLKNKITKTCGKETLFSSLDWLYSEKYYYLLTLFENKYTNASSARLALNKLMINERFQYVEQFFDNANFDYAVIKGVPLSSIIYNNWYAKVSNDIDILIKREDLTKVSDLLRNLGFIQGKFVNGQIVPYTREQLLFYSFNTHQIAPFLKQLNSEIPCFITIDINYDIWWGESSNYGDMNYVLSNVETAMFKNVKFKKLTSEMEFISLCMHHYKDLNSLFLLCTKGILLSHFIEIYLYILNRRPDIDKLCYIAKKLKLSKYIYYCLYYIDKLFDDKIVEKYMIRFIGYKDEELLNSFGLAKNEIMKWNKDFYDRIFNDNIQKSIFNSLNKKERLKIILNSQFL